MKLSPVLLDYLAANKKLSLPGIGTFYLEGSYDPDFDGKKPNTAHNISFRQEKVEKFDESVISFVAKETGKMTVLAESDLISQLDDVMHYLNTGKPYFFAGFGTLTRKQTGVFNFHPEKFTSLLEKKKEKEIPITEKNIVPQSYIDTSSTGRKSMKPALITIGLLLIAIAATVWFYLKNQETETQHVEEVTESAELAPGSTVVQTDSASTTTAPNTQQPSPPGTYTYVLETTKEPRASKRFNQLKSINWPVELEVVDSMNKRIVMKLPAAGADTSRIKDSLRVLSGKPVFIVR